MNILPKGRTGTIILGAVAGAVLVGFLLKSSRTNPTGVAGKAASTIGLI